MQATFDHPKEYLDDLGYFSKTGEMPLLDHLGITVDDLHHAISQFHPVMDALGFTRDDAENSVAWSRDGETELILFPAREAGTGPHRHGEVGWQHLARSVNESR